MRCGNLIVHQLRDNWEVKALFSRSELRLGRRCGVLVQEASFYSSNFNGADECLVNPIIRDCKLFHSFFKCLRSNRLIFFFNF